MHDVLVNLPKVLLPLLGIVLLVLAAPRRGLNLREDVGFRRPTLLPALLWIAAWLVLTAGEEFVGRRFGAGEAKVWPTYSASVIVERVLAIGILGPIAEELAFRGMLLAWLRRRMNVYGALTLVAAIWTLFHFGSPPSTLLIIFCDGLFLGFARVKTSSLWVPITMHIVGNLYSIGQSLHYVK